MGIRIYSCLHSEVIHLGFFQDHPVSTQPDSPLGSEAPTALPRSVTSPGEAVSLPEDQLPDYEPLTPELVEDEAIRGDFVIRWAVVLLALLFGWTQIDDTSLLVRIRNGQQHLLPFGNDTFSASASDRSWANLAWLYDPILAGVYGVLGATGLTMLGAVVAALTFWCLSRISVKGVSTWWGSVCAAIALVAVYPQLVPGPTGITLLGVTLVSYWLYRWSENHSERFPWALPVTIWLWSQLDPRAYIGAMIVLLYTLGWTGLRKKREGDGPDLAKRLWKVTGACLVAWVLHPLCLHVVRSPWTAYRTEYPELRAYRGFDWPQVWQWFPVGSLEFSAFRDVFAWAGLVLCGLAVLVVLLNFRRIAWEWVLPWVGVVALAACGAHQLPVAALLSCMVITLNAQLWYRGTFSQQYTVDSMPLAWNRGGRAITVMSLLVLGLVASNGMLMGRDGRRIGSGFSPLMKANITGAEKLVSEVAAKEVFNFRLEQGDLLIWAGLKPYVDRRVTLYAEGPENLLKRHRELRYALLTRNAEVPERGKPEVWKKEFDRLHINQAIPRLSGPSPDYLTMVDMNSQGWSLTSLQSFGAVLSRPDSPDEAFQKYRQDHPDVDFVKQAFRSEAPQTPTTDGPWIFPRRPTVYDKYLWQPQTSLSEPLQLASHEDALAKLLSGNPQMGYTNTALALSALRHARQGIILDPQSAVGYSLLAHAAHNLYQTDSDLAANFGVAYPSNVWLYQALSAYQHSVQLDPGVATIHEELATLLLKLQKRDLALHHMVELYHLKGHYTTLPESDPRFKQVTKVNQNVVTELKRHVKKVTEAALKAKVDGGTWEKSFQEALNGQCPALALEYLEANRVEVAKRPPNERIQLQKLQVGLLLDCGRTEDAVQQAESLENMLPKTGPEAAQPLATEIRMLAALANLTNGNNTRFEELIQMVLQASAESAVRGLVDQAPLAVAPPAQIDLLIPGEGVTAFNALYQAANNRAGYELMLAQSELSGWHNDAAKARLQAILDEEPNVNQRALIAFYLELLTGERQQPFTPEQRAIMEKVEAAREAEEKASQSQPPTSETPTETQPAEGQPTESQPAEEKPSETPPATTPPAEPATPAEGAPPTAESTSPPASPPAEPTPPSAVPESPPVEQKQPE